MEWVEAIRTAISYVENHLEDDCLTTESVADVVHISSFHFQKGFSVVCGITLTEYIRNRRLSLAGRDLQAEGNKVIDIALKYGYESADSFSKAFTRFHGTTVIKQLDLMMSFLKSQKPIRFWEKNGNVRKWS